MSIANLFAPKVTDVEYGRIVPLKISLIFRMDSYKFSHPFANPSEVEGMSCYGVARVGQDQPIVVSQVQAFLNRTFMDAITDEDVEAAQAFALAHFGRPLFFYSAWKRVVSEFGGHPPLIIRSVREGMPVRGGDALYSVTCLVKGLSWMAAAFETVVLRGFWYPTTVATADYETKQEIVYYYVKSGLPVEAADFALHDFGGRGVTCGEQAEIGGAAHLVNFRGSDTVEGVLASNHYYDEAMSGFSVYATEHSVECSFGLDPEGERRYLRHQIIVAHFLNLDIASVVIDGKDTMRCAAVLCEPEFVELIKSGPTKIVFRPDSGDMFQIVPAIIEMQQRAYGYTLTSTGHRRTNSVGVIQGDGVDRSAIRTLLGNLLIMGYAADCVVFGSGGALLQKVNRDTLKFAQKASAILVREWIDMEHHEIGDAANGTVLRWQGIAKNPVTDPGKKSQAGVLTLMRDPQGQLHNVDLTQDYDPDWEDLHQLVYHTGKLFNKENLATIRNRVA